MGHPAVTFAKNRASFVLAKPWIGESSVAAQSLLGWLRFDEASLLDQRSLVAQVPRAAPAGSGHCPLGTSAFLAPHQLPLAHQTHLRLGLPSSYSTFRYFIITLYNLASLYNSSTFYFNRVPLWVSLLSISCVQKNDEDLFMNKQNDRSDSRKNKTLIKIN